MKGSCCDIIFTNMAIIYLLINGIYTNIYAFNWWLCEMILNCMWSFRCIRLKGCRCEEDERSWKKGFKTEEETAMKRSGKVITLICGYWCIFISCYSRIEYICIMSWICTNVAFVIVIELLLSFLCCYKTRYLEGIKLVMDSCWCLDWNGCTVQWEIWVSLYKRC